jgi:hypothetical protein
VKQSTALIGAVKGAAEENFGAVKGRKRAVIIEESSREGPAGPGNPDSQQSAKTFGFFRIWIHKNTAVYGICKSTAILLKIMLNHLTCVLILADTENAVEK